MQEEIDTNQSEPSNSGSSPQSNPKSPATPQLPSNPESPSNPQSPQPSNSPQDSPIDSSDDEGDDILPTEADMKFIADASESEEEIGHKKRRKRKRQVVQEEDLDDEDLELLNENYGIKKETRWKKLRRKGDDDDDGEINEPVKELMDLFDDDEGDEKPVVAAQETREIFDVFVVLT